MPIPSNIKVFLSHKKEDEAISIQIATYLRANGLDVYLDTIDDNLYRDGPDLADYIRAQLDTCTQLLAVISRQTAASWWVPWEIGVASEKERFLASFVAGDATVPEYLQKWPYLRNQRDLDVYIQESKSAQRIVESYVQRGTGRTAAQSTGFREFHRGLKRALGQ